MTRTAEYTSRPMPRSPTRAHERTAFFKYMPAATARVVLSSATLRWSSPLRFNDVFDTPREMALGIEASDVSAALETRLKQLVLSPPTDTSGLNPKVRVLVEAARRAPPETRPEFAHAITQGFAGQQPADASLDELRALWRGFIPDFRILCLTEDHASASMWDRYADALRGAVLEFACMDELDSPWLAARPVTYDTRPEDMFTARELADIILMPLPQTQNALLERATFRKSPDWSNEREWRVVSSKRASGVGEFTDFPFNPEELASIYLGPKMSAEDRAALIAAARAFPRVRVVQVEIGKGPGFRFAEVMA